MNYYINIYKNIKISNFQDPNRKNNKEATKQKNIFNVWIRIVINHS